MVSTGGSQCYSEGEKMKMLIFLLLAITSSVAFGFRCPENQYLYKNCSVCFFPSPLDHILTFEEASSFCSAGGGALLSFITQGDLNRVGRYLVGLQLERREFWVGYRHSVMERVAEDGGSAPQVVLNTTNFITGRTQPGRGRCIGVKGEKLVTRSCTTELNFICEYFYTVPAPEVSPENQTVYASFGSNFTLSATIPFPGVSEIVWKLNGSTLTSNQNGIEIRTSSMELEQTLHSTLTTSGFRSHSGAYLLAVRNAAGVAMVMEWHVQEPVLRPLTYEPTDLSVTRGQIAAFECHALNSTPPPTVTWYKDSSQSPLESSGRVYVSQETGTLYIREVVVGDGGMYRCVLENLAGIRTSRRARLTVATSFPAGVDPPGQAELYFHPKHKTSALEEAFVFDCVGHFTATVVMKALVFYQEGPSIGEEQHVFAYPDKAGFPQFRLESMGMRRGNITYFCVVFHDHYLTDLSQTGHYIAGNSTVTVLGAAFISNFYTEWNETNSSALSHSISPGSEVTIHCNFDGWPRPVSSAVKWYRDNVELHSGVFTSDSSSTLTIQDFSLSGVYQCHVTNQHGSDIASVFLCLQQQDVIPDVVSFLAVPDTTTSIYVKWTGDRSGTDPLLLRYHVSISSNSSVAISFVLFAEARDHVIQNLDPSETYHVTVRASSLKGVAEPHPQSVSTFPNAPTQPFPDSVVRAVFNSTVMVVSWDTFTPSSGPPLPPATSYQVQLEYREVGGAGGRSINVIVNGTERQAIIPFSGHDNYQVRIRVLVQSQRDPRTYSYSPWTSYIPVTGMASVRRTTALPLTPILLSVGVITIVVIVGVAVMLGACWFLFRSGARFSLARKRNYRITTLPDRIEATPHHPAMRYVSESSMVTEEGCSVKQNLGARSFSAILFTEEETDTSSVQQNLAASSCTEENSDASLVKQNLAAQRFTEEEDDTSLVKRNLSFAEKDVDTCMVKHNLTAHSFKKKESEKCAVHKNLATPAISVTDVRGQTIVVEQTQKEDSDTSKVKRNVSAPSFTVDESEETSTIEQKFSASNFTEEEESSIVKHLSASSFTKEGSDTSMVRQNLSASSFTEDGEFDTFLLSISRSRSEGRGEHYLEAQNEESNTSTIKQNLSAPNSCTKEENVLNQNISAPSFTSDTFMLKQNLPAPSFTEEEIFMLNFSAPSFTEKGCDTSIVNQNHSTSSFSEEGSETSTLKKNFSAPSFTEKVRDTCVVKHNFSAPNFTNTSVLTKNLSTPSFTDEVCDTSIVQQSLSAPSFTEKVCDTCIVKQNFSAPSLTKEESDTSMLTKDLSTPSFTDEVRDTSIVKQSLSAPNFTKEESETSLVELPRSRSEGSSVVQHKLIACSSSEEESKPNLATLEEESDTSVVQNLCSRSSTVTQDGGEDSTVEQNLAARSSSIIEEGGEDSMIEQNLGSCSSSVTEEGGEDSMVEQNLAAQEKGGENFMVEQRFEARSSSVTEEGGEDSTVEQNLGTPIITVTDEEGEIFLLMASSSCLEEKSETSSESDEGGEFGRTTTLTEGGGMELRARPSGKHHGNKTHDRKHRGSV